MPKLMDSSFCLFLRLYSFLLCLALISSSGGEGLVAASNNGGTSSTSTTTIGVVRTSSGSSSRPTESSGGNNFHKTASSSGGGLMKIQKWKGGGAGSAGDVASDSSSSTTTVGVTSTSSSHHYHKNHDKPSSSSSSIIKSTNAVASTTSVTSSASSPWTSTSSWFPMDSKSPELLITCDDNDTQLPGCNDPYCQKRICYDFNQTHCCEVEWSSECAALASQVCFPEVIPIPPGTTSCPNGFVCNEVRTYMSNCSDIRQMTITLQLGDLYGGVYCPAGANLLKNCPEGMFFFLRMGPSMFEVKEVKRAKQRASGVILGFSKYLPHRTLPILMFNWVFLFLLWLKK